MLVMSVVLCCAISTGSDEIIHPCLDSFSLIRLQLCILLYLAFEKTQALITFFWEALTCSPKGQPISLATFNCSQSHWVLKNDSLFPFVHLPMLCFWFAERRTAFMTGVAFLQTQQSHSKQTNTFSWACSRVGTHKNVSNDGTCCWALIITCSPELHSLQETQANLLCKLPQRGKCSVIILNDACPCERW